MRALTWLLGVMLILLGLESRGLGSSGWAAVWITAAVLWFFAGCVLGVAAITRLVAGKTVAGLARSVRAGQAHSSATLEEKH